MEVSVIQTLAVLSERSPELSSRKANSIPSHQTASNRLTIRFLIRITMSSGKNDDQDGDFTPSQTKLTTENARSGCSSSSSSSSYSTTSTSSYSYSPPFWGSLSYSPDSDSSMQSIHNYTSTRFMDLLRARQEQGYEHRSHESNRTTASGSKISPSIPPKPSQDEKQLVEFFLERGARNGVTSPGAPPSCGLNNLRIVVGDPPTPQQLIRKNYRVWGIDVDKFTGKIYVADRESNIVRVFSSEGVQVAEFGNGLLQHPTGIAMDLPNKRILVSSKQTHRICIFSLDGKYITSIGRRGIKVGDFNYPWGVAVSPAGDKIVVADSANHRIQTFDKVGHLLNSYSVYEVNPYKYITELDYPRGVCFDEHGRNIYVADFNIHAIFKFPHDLRDKTTFVPPGRLVRPQGLTVDESGNVLVCDSGNSVVRVITPSGALLANIHGEGENNYPQDLALLPFGQLAILDGAGVIRFY